MGDMFSNLPDELVIHIFSFLPTEDSFAASLACKRFTPFWLSVPNLDLDEHRIITQPGKNNNKNTSSSLIKKSHSSFVHFASAAILRRGIHQPIKTLRLKGYHLTATRHILTWLKAAAKRDTIENLEINGYYKAELLRLPCSILISKTLVVLKLRDTAFKVSFSIHLPSLKTLHLESVVILKPHNLTELLNGCPELEVLRLINGIRFSVFDGPSLEGKVNTLSKLVLAQFDFWLESLEDDKSFCIVEFLRLDEIRHVNNPLFPNLLDMELTAKSSKGVLNLLNHCPQLQTLFLDNGLDDDDVYPVWPNTPETPFSLAVRICLLINCRGTEWEMRFLKFVLQNSPLLRFMVILCHPRVNPEVELEMRIELYSCPRSSVTCKLLIM